MAVADVSGWPGVPVAMSTVVGTHTTSLLEEPACHWGYAGEYGPTNWGSMCDAKFPTCASGKTQSPVDITSGAVVAYTQRFLNVARWKAETLSWNIPPATIDTYAKLLPPGAVPEGMPSELFNGHTYEVEHVKATLKFGDTDYTLKHFNMHTESEHTFDGGHYDLEMHFVHTATGPDGSEKVLVIACFYQAIAGTSSPQYFKELVAGISHLTTAPSTVVPLNFRDMAQQVMVGGVSTSGAQEATFQPNFKNYLAYTGSLTTPPCTEGVQWLLLRNPVFVAPQDVDKIKNLEGANWRPTQPLNGRSVFWVNN